MSYGNKYYAAKVQTPEGTFDSKKEYRRWCELKLLERGKVIQDLQRQVPFELVPAQYEEYERISPKTGRILTPGKRCIEKAITYNADFVYTQGGKTVVEDTKSPATRTKDYIIKRKLMLWVHGIRIKEV